MKALSLLVRAATCAALSLIAFSAVAADYPTPQEGDWVAPDFRFHTGEVMPDLRLHYTTVGAPLRTAGTYSTRHRPVRDRNAVARLCG